MIARFALISQEAEVGATGFRDLPPDNWAAPIVIGAQKAGLLDYLQDKLFEAKRPLTRAEVVEMLRQTAPVKKILDNDLLDWEDNY